MIEKKQKIIDKLIKESTLLYVQSKDETAPSLSLGECCQIKTGKLNVDESSNNGKYLFFTCGKDELLIDTYAFDCKAIIISGNGVISVKYYEGKFNAYQRTYVLEPTKYFYIFLKECELSIDDLKNNSQGSVIKFITKGMLESISINVNSESSELNNKLEKIYKTMSLLNKQISKLKKIKEKLLSKYF